MNLTSEQQRRQRIAIIGAGPAGLCLARILQLHNNEKKHPNNTLFDVVVYEADISSNSRTSQGGSLDLHISTGQRALRTAQLYNEFRNHIQIGADKLMIRNANDGTILYQDNGNNLRPEIERNDLRNILLNSLEPNTVRYGMKLCKIQEEVITNDDSDQKDTTMNHNIQRIRRRNRIQLIFNNNYNVVETCDIVIGADGAWSKVRNVLTDIKPQYTGLSIWDIEIPNNNNKTKIPNGTLFALDDINTVMIGHINQNSIHTYIGRICDKGKLPSIDKLIYGWNNELVKLVETKNSYNNNNNNNDKTNPPKTTLREIYALPIGIQWKRPIRSSSSNSKEKPYNEQYNDYHWTYNVGIIGDAAHLMSPMAGEGVNLALADATDLAYILINNRSIIEFEYRYLYRRAKHAAIESHQNLQLFFISTSHIKNSNKKMDDTPPSAIYHHHPALIVTKKMKDLMSLQNIIIQSYNMIIDWFIDCLWMIGWKQVEQS